MISLLKNPRSLLLRSHVSRTIVYNLFIVLKKVCAGTIKLIACIILIGNDLSWITGSCISDRIDVLILAHTISNRGVFLIFDQKIVSTHSVLLHPAKIINHNFIKT